MAAIIVAASTRLGRGVRPEPGQGWEGSMEVGGPIPSTLLQCARSPGGTRSPGMEGGKSRPVSPGPRGRVLQAFPPGSR